MQSKATTVAQYLKELTDERRATVEAVRQVVRTNVDPLVEEGMQYGMIGWYVPHAVFPAGYHVDPKQPLPFAALASQKNYCSLYLMSVYADDTPGEQWLRKAWAKSGKKLDMGKSCIRFKRVDDLALEVIGEALRRISVADHLAAYARVDPRQRVQTASGTVQGKPSRTKGATKSKAPAAKPKPKAR